MKGILLLLLSFNIAAADVGFERGDTIKTDEIEGVVSVTCEENGQTRSMSLSCYDIALIGGAYGKIIVRNGMIDADWVKLRREGTNKIKGSAFNSELQQTGSNFNLWIATLFQRPLLKKGKNLIHYEFTKKNQSIENGSFEVEVVEGEFRTCGRGSLYYYSSCPPSNIICGEYFRKHNYCR